MATFLVRDADVDTACDHPLCSTVVSQGEQVYPARLREQVYCSSTCRQRHSKIIVQERRRADPVKNRRDNDKRIQRKYGISSEEWQTFYDLQLGRCAICQVPLSEVRVMVDHQHGTGRVRGLLCNYCNPGIGFFEDDPALLDAAAEYLRMTERR
jgi:hypothetical protein